MKYIEKESFDAERALYGCTDTAVVECSFDGPADGESAFKECRNISAEDSYFNLRYPFWHDNGVRITGCHMTENCRAALWYSENIDIVSSKLHGIKALRECKNASIKDCGVISAEFGWRTSGLKIEDSELAGEYFCFGAKNVSLSGTRLTGKYSFQYVENAVFSNCELNTKDSLWHARNVHVKDCVIKGEYLAWYCENVTFERCKIIGTQPLCYCKGLRLIDCEMIDTDLAFEKSEVEATVCSFVESIKNPAKGKIVAAGVGEIILDDENARGVIEISEALCVK